MMMEGLAECTDPRVQSVFQEDLGHSALTPVQQATIPKFLAHCDVAVEACTGSGKTLAFVIPVVQLALRGLRKETTESEQDDGEENDSKKKSKSKSKKKKARLVKRKPYQLTGLIVSPTRELAQQTFKVLNTFASAVKLKTMLLTGGTNVMEDVETLGSRVVDIIVGTPGRIDDIMSRAHHSLDYKRFEVLVLDEADVLLDMGFERSVTSILGRLPKQRRTGLFSATQTKEVKALIRAGLRNPAIISVQVQQENNGNQQQKTPTSLENFYLECEADEKLQILANFILQQEAKKKKTIVFFSTCASVAFFESCLKALFSKRQNSQKGKKKEKRKEEKKKDQNKDDLSKVESGKVLITSLHGKMTQKKRMKTYNSFLEQEGGVLFCTDVAARGIDIPDMDWIVQFDPPQDPSFFVHRVGRTARAGRRGKSLIFLLPKESAYVNLLRDTRKVPILEYHEKQDLIGEKYVKVASVLESIKAEIWKDRDLLEKGTRAFIAHLRSYKEHKCPFIFRLSDLDMGRLAKAFILFQLPNVKELRETKGLKDFQEEPADKVNAIPFKDKNREKQRQRKYKELMEERAREKANRAESKKRKREEQKQKEAQLLAQPKRRNKSKQKELYAEWEELGREERLYKKMRKGKISKKAYDDLIFNLK